MIQGKYVLRAMCALIVFSGSLVACHEAARDLGSVNNAETLASELQSRGEAMLGEVVTVRGFLAPLSGHLVIYPNEAEALSANHYDDAVHVLDTTPMRRMRHEGLYYEQTCTGRYVELKGVVGFLEPYGFYGITEIDSVRKYETDDYIGSGEACYSKDDRTIYQPVEIELK
jgi:hypothetical protein